MVPKFEGMTQPSQEVQYAREKYHPDKVKIMMTKSVLQRDDSVFGMDIGRSYKKLSNVPSVSAHHHQSSFISSANQEDSLMFSSQISIPQVNVPQKVRAKNRHIQQKNFSMVQDRLAGGSSQMSL